MDDHLYRYQRLIANRINRHEIANYFLLDWRRLTDGFKTERLHCFIFCINDRNRQIAAINGCLFTYRLYLMATDYKYYLAFWDHGCPFRDYCDVLIKTLEKADNYTVTSDGPTPALKENKRRSTILDTEQAQKLLGRLPNELYCAGKWAECVTKAFKSQVAYVVGKLLGINGREKWIGFENLWGVEGLGKAFYALNGRPLDKLILSVYPEYNDILYKV